MDSIWIDPDSIWIDPDSIWISLFLIHFYPKFVFLNCFQSKMISTPAFHLLFHKTDWFQFKNLKKRRFFVHTHTTFDVCVWTIVMKNGIFWKDILWQKNVTKKFLAEKNVTDFFSNSRIKKILILKMNRILDFSFLKKQWFYFLKKSIVHRSSIIIVHILVIKYFKPELTGYFIFSI